MNEPKNIERVKPKDWIPFQCQMCGACCRQVKDSIMLEPMDIYRLARFLRDRGENIAGPEDTLAEYAHADILEDCLPIYLINTEGPEDACVFLKDGKCSIYEARPRVCRLYPFTAAPGDRGRDFLYCLCTERPHHFTGRKESVKDWFYQNFSKDAREFVKADYEGLSCLGRNVRKMGPERFKRMLFQFLLYRYYNYDLDQPFLPQFRRNMEALLELTKDAAEETGG